MYCKLVTFWEGRGDVVGRTGGIVFLGGGVGGVIRESGEQRREVGKIVVINNK